MIDVFAEASTACRPRFLTDVTWLADPTRYYYNPSNGTWLSEQGQVLSPRTAQQIPQSAIDKANQYLGAG
jgi:hypothetical protein